MQTTRTLGGFNATDFLKPSDDSKNLTSSVNQFVKSNSGITNTNILETTDESSKNLSSLINKFVKSINNEADNLDPNTESFEDDSKEFETTAKAIKIGSSIGLIVALAYSFKVKSGFSKGFGYVILGSMALGGIGAGIGLAIDTSKKK
jgi:hypothetical protein